SAVRWHNWYNAPKTWAKVLEIDPVGSHASWMENYPWTRLEGVALPAERKALFDLDKLALLTPRQTREQLVDGNMGGYYQRSDADMMAIWQVAVAETRDLLEGDWS
ncbi:MAG: creatininase family protein, partial [Anaerolineae bacterium]|nr:creatininase family protein [Anaerolineae bacterium]